MVQKQKNARVLVTGASGFVGIHTVKQLLEDGYTVRGTVRSVKNQAKIQPITSLKYADERLELVEANLDNAADWPKAVDSCDYVLHVASPLPLIQDESIIKTAVDGTLNVLRACAKCHSVKKVVQTSSLSAVMRLIRLRMSNFLVGHEDNDRILTEEDWSDIDGPGMSFYDKSKTIAERKAWDFVKNIPDGDNHFKFTVFNPGFIVGPVLTNDEGTSVTIIKKILNRELPAVPAIHMPSVDVRDVARAHIEAMENSNTDSERICLATKAIWLKDLAHVLSKEFTPQGYCIPTMGMPYFGIWLASFFDKQVKPVLGIVGIEHKLDNSKSKKLLKMEFHSIDQASIDMAYSLIERGIVPKKRNYEPKRYE